MANIDELNTGWIFKETGDESPTAWAPAHQVPGTIHADLLHNGRFVKNCGCEHQQAHHLIQDCRPLR
jgi:hypothetical protein